MSTCTHCEYVPGGRSSQTASQFSLLTVPISAARKRSWARVINQRPAARSAAGVINWAEDYRRTQLSIRAVRLAEQGTADTSSL